MPEAADYLGPGAQARVDIDNQLTAAGWVVQRHKQMNLGAGRGVAVREFPMAEGYGDADYLLFVDRKAVGVVEAKKKGSTLTGVEWVDDCRVAIGELLSGNRVSEVLGLRRVAVDVTICSIETRSGVQSGDELGLTAGPPDRDLEAPRRPARVWRARLHDRRRRGRRRHQA